MASTCYQPITHSSADASIVNFSKPLPPYDASWFGCSPRFNLSAMDLPAPMDDCGFQAPPAAGESLPSARTVDLSEDGEALDSDDDDDDDDLRSMKQILASSKRAIDLTGDDDDDGEGGDGDFTETASSLLTYSLHAPPSSSQKSPAHTADDRTMLPAAATPTGKKSPWKNVPSWSPLHHKLQQHSTTPLCSSALDTFHAGSDSPGSTLTQLEPLAVNSRHDVGPYADLKHDGAMSDGHEWQAQCIVGERQTSSGLEYEVSVQKTLWLPRAMLNTKLLRKYRAEHRAATRVRTRWSSRLQKTGSSVRQCR